MTHFADQLVARIADLSNPTVVGLDPHFEMIPEFIRKDAERKHGKTTLAAAHAILTFNHGIIDALADLVPAVKPQIAFYECFGFEGLRAYQETCAYAKKKGLLVIGDAKRNDIGSTAEAYARGHLGKVDLFGTPTEIFSQDALTITPYLGSDGIHPFIKQAQENDKGIFVLVRTSNASADEIQGQPVGEELMDEVVAGLVSNWGRETVGKSGFSLVGAVVGATYPEEANILRSLMPHQIFLVPGFGAQGGTAADVKPCFHKNGTGAIVNSSRGIIFAGKDEGYAEAARKSAIKMKEELATLF
jgi:orotidine-5'-phosphate decarboxylase